MGRPRDGWSFPTPRPCPRASTPTKAWRRCLFLESDEVCETSYRDRGGKYQGQVGVTLPKI